MTFDQLKDKIVWAVVGAVGIWLLLLTQRSVVQPTRSELKELIEQGAPYTKERAMILDRIEKLTIGETRIADELDRSIRETFTLRVDLERLLAVKPADVYERVGALEQIVGKAIERLERRQRRPHRKETHNE